jgi:hypothetical protein
LLARTSRRPPLARHRPPRRLKESAHDAPEVGHDNWTVYTLRDGLVVAVTEYPTLEEALEAVGLRE